MSEPTEREWLEGADDPVLQALWDERLADAWHDCVAQGEAFHDMRRVDFERDQMERADAEDAVESS